MGEFIRNCPSCGIELKYKSEKNCIDSEKNKKLCKKCAAKIRENDPIKKEKNRQNNLGKNNPMYGKTIYEVWIEKYGIEEANKRKQLHAEHSARAGELNGMHGKTVYETWIKKYGKEIANQKLQEYKQLMSEKNSGENNPMYGKPAPKKSGNGWSGYYQNHYFRSMLELHYLIYLLDNNIQFESGELKQHSIEYEMDGIERNYFPDYYLINEDKYIEIKPKALINTKQNKLKFEAAKQKLGNKHIIITEDQIVKINLQILYNMYINKEIIFDKGYDIKFEEYYNKNERR